MTTGASRPLNRRTIGRLARWLPVCVALLLGGCASTRVIDSEVRSFVGTVAPQQQASFRFDRLPSQQSSDPQAQAFQEQLEAMAISALTDIGLTPTEQEAQYLVQVTASVELVARAPVFPSMSLGGFWGFHRPPYGVGMSYYMEPPWSRYGVHLVLRSATTQQVMFESSAQHVGPWSDTANVLPAVLRAALRDYPKPAPQGRTVRVEVSPQGMSDRP